jgi:NAD(P)H dehydrogenase (quinone)
MRILTVFAHPNRNSFSGALLDAFLAGLGEAGHEIELADLYAEGFDPCFQPADYAQFTGGPADMPEGVRREQARVDRAQAIAFVFPVWWWSFPAILKGWIDRVWCQGWAYDFTIGRSRGLLTLSKAVLLCSAGSSGGVYRRYGYQEAMRRSIDVGILGYCGIDDVAMNIFPAVDDDPAAREEYLRMSSRIGREFDKTDAVVTLSSLSRPDRQAQPAEN